MLESSIITHLNERGYTHSMTHADLLSHPNPASTYTEAARRIEAWEAEAPPDNLAAGRLLFLRHGQKVERAVVFVHGYTSACRQFEQLGQMFYERGYNVLIPPLPYHGLADRMTPLHAKILASDLAAYGDRAVDIAQGLGNAVTVAGLSMGGVVTAWVGQYRRDVALAALIAPGLGVYVIPAPLTPLGVSLMLRLPNFYQWWDPVRKADDGFPYGYPRYATRTLGEMMRLGLSVRRSARTTPPAASALLLVTNANDFSVNHTVAKGLAQAWQRQGAKLRTFEFAASLGLPHDLISPQQPVQRVDVVYPKLMELMDAEAHA